MARLMLSDELWFKLKKNSKIGNADMDWGLYKYRHLVENVFARLKQF